MIKRILALLLCAVMFTLPMAQSVSEGVEAAEAPVVADTAAPTQETTATPAPTPEPTSEPTPETPPVPETEPVSGTETPTAVPAEEGTAVPSETPTETPTVAPLATPTTAILAANYADQAAVLVLGEQSLDITENFSFYLYNAPSADEYTLTVDGVQAKEGYLFRDPGDNDPALAEAIASSQSTPSAPLTLQAGLELNARYVLALRLLNEGEERVTVTLTAQNPQPSLVPEATLSQEDYYLSLLDLDAYTFSLSSKQKQYKAYGRENAGLYRSMKEGKQYAAGQAMVSVRSQEEAEQVAAAYHATLLNYNGQGIALIALPEGIPAQDMMVLSSREDVNLPSLEPNRIKTLYSTNEMQRYTPQDPAYSKQWFHKTMGDDIAWDYTTGAGVTVAVIDSGCMSTHGEFNNRISAKSMIIDEYGGLGTPGSHPYDPDGHGTHVCGIIAANQNNGYGGCGVAPNAKLVVCQMRGLDPASEVGLTEFALINAMNYVASLPEVSIVNMSLGSHYSWGHTPEEEEAVANLAANKLVIVAAGNDNYGRAGFPAAYPEVMAVSATTSANRKAGFSNYGPEIDITAPGVSIYSTVSYSDYFDTYEGTSMASPAVAGAAALVISRFGCTPAQARNYLLRSAKDLKNANYYGAGLVQTGQAVTGRNVAVKTGSSKGGTVSGGGFYEYGSTPTFTATPNAGYTFVNWKKGSTVVSIDPVFSGYVVASDGASFTANFAALPKASVTASVCSYSSNLITWKALPNASYYKVYRSATATGTFEDVSGEIAYNAATNVYAFEDTGRTFGVSSFYKVETVFETGMTVSAVKSVKTNWPTMKIVKAEQAGPVANRLTWNAVPNVSGYTLTRTIGGVKATIEVVPSSLTTSVDPKLGNLVTYEDTAAGITMNATAAYMVQARVGEAGPTAILSKASTSKTVKAGWGKVTVTAASGAYGGNTVKYPITITLVPAPNAAGHELWWSLDKNSWTTVTMSGSTYTISGIVTGVPVYIQVRPFAGTASAHTSDGPWTALTARSIPTAPANFYVAQNLSDDDNGHLYYAHVGIYDEVLDASGYEYYQSKDYGKTFARVTSNRYIEDNQLTLFMPVATIAQIYARMGYLYKVRAYVTYKAVKYYGPFSPIVVSGDIENTLLKDWNSTTGITGSRMDRLTAFITEQQKELGVDQAQLFSGDAASIPKTK